MRTGGSATGCPLLNKLRWAITEGLKIYVHACENHQDMMNRAEELIASVGEEYRVTVSRRLTKGWQEQEFQRLGDQCWTSGTNRKRSSRQQQQHGKTQQEEREEGQAKKVGSGRRE